MTGSAEAQVDLAAIAHNLGEVRRIAPQSRTMAVIKANAYGHGADRVARGLEEADAFGVAKLHEAEALRSAGIESPITVLGGVLNDVELRRAEAAAVDIVVHSHYQLELLTSGFRGRVWPKFNVGMNRLGFPLSSVESVLKKLDRSRIVGLMTHLPSADTDRHETERQIEAFLRATERLGFPRSLANSAALIRYPEARQDWVRPGLMLYGVSPYGDEGGITGLSLRQAMTLTAPVISINQISAGEKVGYGGCWVATRDTWIAVLAVGYADGYPREIENGHVVVRGRHAGLAGKVSMDMICVELKDETETRIGDRVELWGNQLPIGKVAHAAGTIPYTLMCQVGDRVRRCYVQLA